MRKALLITGIIFCLLAPLYYFFYEELKTVGIAIEHRMIVTMLFICVAALCFLFRWLANMVVEAAQDLKNQL